MAENKRTPAERERDLEVIARKYCRGETQQQIAAYLEISQPQVCYDLKEIINRWRESSREFISEKIIIEIEKINHLERTYWEAWERSLQSKRLRRRMVKQTLVGSETTRESKFEQREGNVSYLVGVQWCIERRLNLLQGKDGIPLQSEQPAKQALPFMAMPIPLREKVLEWWGTQESPALPAPTD